jgi:thiamine-monophosphate kinase
MAEFELIRRFFARSASACPPPQAFLGIGDDCAILAAPKGPHGRFAITTDMLVAGVHFFADVDPQALGHKALAVNLSDLAAMGARPVAYVLALAMPHANGDWLAAFARGMHALADRHQIELVGGDTTSGPLTVGITALGEVDPASALRRDRARVGDDLWVSGTLGGSALAVAERRAGRGHSVPLAAQLRLDWPNPRVDLGLALAQLAAHGRVHAAIDVSDGLASELGHLLQRSEPGLGARLWSSRLPADPVLRALAPIDQLELMLHGGDDYELLFTAPASARGEIEALAGRFDGVALTRFGMLEAGSGLVLEALDGTQRALPARGFEHFGGAEC